MNIHECGSTMWDAFLRDIVEHPDDLTPRLILADWLEEQPHPTQQARAEFIRLMVEGAAKATQQARRTLVMQQAHSILRHCFPQWWLPGWAPLKLWHAQIGRNGTYHVELPYHDRLTVVLHDSRGLSATFRRGFVEELRLPLSMLEQYVGRLFTTCPLRKVDLTDRHPLEDDSAGWCWFRDDMVHGAAPWPDSKKPATLPLPIFQRLPSFRYTVMSVVGACVAYASDDEARDACSRAILAWGRELQGMPPLRALSS